MVKRNAVVSVSDSNVPQVFSNDQFGQVRIVMQDNGEPLFCLKDACDCLDLAQPSKVASRLDKDDVHSIPTLTEGGMQEMLFITESGLYDAILGARKNPKTKPFKKWVTKEVLPSIRKTGSYSVQQTNFVIPASYAEALRLAADKAEFAEKETKRADKAEAEKQQLENKVESLEVELADAENEFVKVGKQYGIKDRKNASKGYMAVGKFNETNFFKQHCKDYKAEKFYHALIELGFAVKDGDGIYRHTNNLNGLLETAYTYRGKVDEPIGYCVRFDVSRSAELWEIIKPKMELKKKSAKCSTISK